MHRPPGISIRASALAWLAVIALTLVACDGAARSTTPGATGTSSLAPPATATPGSGAGDSPATGQTDTAWGRIWDSVPGGFPTFPGSTVADEGAPGPVSATFVADGDVAREVATSFADALEQAGYTVDGAMAPLEDGSFTIEAIGASDCRVQVTSTPTGGLTTISILYGAACPAP